MICYGDTTFCASPHCTNACQRKMPKEIEHEAKKSGLLISWAYFCGEKQEVNNDCDTEQLVK